MNDVPLPVPSEKSPGAARLANVRQVIDHERALVFLEEVAIERFRNFMGTQAVEVEPDVTCLVGKNESGKTTVLKALHRLKPANGGDVSFRLTTEYPRRHLSRHRRTENLDNFEPVKAKFKLNDEERGKIEDLLGGSEIPPDTSVVLARLYDNRFSISLSCSLLELLTYIGAKLAVDDDDMTELKSKESRDEVVDRSNQLAKEFEDSGEKARAKTLRKLPVELKATEKLLAGPLDSETMQAIYRLVPSFFYFTNYDILPGSANLHELAKKIDDEDESLTPKEQSVVSLLSYAGETVSDLLDEDYDSRKAELQAAASELSSKVFEYWKQNTELAVSLDTDMPVVGKDNSGKEIRERFLRIQLRDERHGGVETNFDTRSSGFQWFFSFLAAFSRFQDQGRSVVVLLDEPGTSLHGEAQRDFVRFIYEELGEAQQVLYTTHSQHMIDPARYEKIRAVNDRATRDDSSLGVEVSKLNLSADRNTVLPVEAALGYSISQHLFLGGGHHLVVEGSSDFVYLQRMSEIAEKRERVPLDPRFSIIPVGSADNAPPFVALLGRRLRVSVLLDGAQIQRKRDRVVAAARGINLSEDIIVVCSQVDGVPNTADIEDLFEEQDYLTLFRAAMPQHASISLPDTDQPIIQRVEATIGKFDHALPAHQLTASRAEFASMVSDESVARFERLFILLNATLDL